MRKQPQVMSRVLDGKLSLVDTFNPDVISYIHQGQPSLMVISNFRAYEVSFRIDKIITGILLHNYGNIEKRGLTLTLRPFETFVLDVE